MPESLPSKTPQSLVHSLHPALSGSNGPPIDWPMPTILACPLPISTLAPEYLLPELSHEIKTPLSGIMGLAQIMQHQAGVMSAREYQYADLIYQKSQQLLIAINDLLDLAQLSTQQFVLHLHPVELYSILNAALQTARRSTGLDLNCTILPEKSEDPLEHWIIADPTRLEQLFTHLINTLVLQSSTERQVQLSFHPCGDWIAITLAITPLSLSENELVHLGWPYQPSSAQVSTLPNRSDAVLKSLLARQLTHLHGGDIGWTSDAISMTCATVLLPRDLTRTTHRIRSSYTSQLLLVISQRTTDLYELSNALIAQGELIIMTRSLPEATEKLQILSPTILAIDSQFAQACGWNVMRTWLNEQLARNHFTLVWIGNEPPESSRDGLPLSGLWPWPLTTQATLEALQQLPKSPVPSTPPSSDSTSSFTILQLGSVSAIAASNSIPFKLLSQLSQDKGCSILAVDNWDQAELLARIWKPKVMICPGPIPLWVSTFLKTSNLVDLPCILLQPTKQNQELYDLGDLDYKIYSTPNDLQAQSIKTAANHLYLYVIDLISGKSKQS